MAKKKNQRGQKKTNVDKYKYSSKGKSKRQQGIDKKIINTFKQGEMKGTIKTNKDNDYLKITLRISKWITSRAANVLKDVRKADPENWRGHDVEAYFEMREKQFQKGEITGDTFKKEVHAIESFRQAANSTSAFGSKKIKIGNHEERRERYKETGAYSSEREITAVKCTLKQASAVHNEMGKNIESIRDRIDSGKLKNLKRDEIILHNMEVSRNVNVFQSIFGTRVSKTLDTKIKYIEINEEKKEIYVHQPKDKNQFSRTVVRKNITNKEMEFVKQLQDGKEPGQNLFEMKTNEGKTMSNYDARKRVNEETKKAAKACGMYIKGSRFNTHSNRKAFAQNEYDKTKYYSKAHLHSLIGEYIQVQGSNKEQIKERLNRELERINKYRTENGLPKKSFNREQLRVLYVSLLLGHSRASIVTRNYIVTDKERAKMEQQAA